MVSTEDGLYYTSHPNEKYFQATVFYYSFDAQKEIVFWKPSSYTGNQIPNKSSLVLDHSNLYYFIVINEINENQILYQSAVVFAIDTRQHSASSSEKNKLLWSKKVPLPFMHYLHELVLEDNTLYISAGQEENGTYCVALDLTSQEVIWETQFKGYIVEQAYANFNHLYCIVSPVNNTVSSRFGFTGHSQQVLELDKETGEIWGKSPESPFSGVYRIDGTYRNNLITQGPDAAYLQICPME
jgi:outer membrane protein assembly factor BamB